MRAYSAWCSGHTFVPTHEVFLPKYALDPPHMAVSVVNANEPTYRSVCYQNQGPTPILFEIDNEPSGLVAVIVSGYSNGSNRPHRHQLQ